MKAGLSPLSIACACHVSQALLYMTHAADYMACPGWLSVSVLPVVSLHGRALRACFRRWCSLITAQCACISWLLKEVR